MGGVIRALRERLAWMVNRLDGSAMWKDGGGVRRRRRRWLVGFDVGSRVGSVEMIRSGRRPSDPL